MSAFSNYAEQTIVNTLLRNGTFTGAGQTYLALFTASPNEDGSGPECNGTNYPGYARVSTGATASAAWNTPAADGLTRNQNAIQFPPVGGASPVTVTHFAIFDAPTGGNMLFHAALTAPKTLDPADVPSFPALSLQITLD